MTPQNRYLFYNLFAYEGKKIAGNQLWLKLYKYFP